jgi:hypothetical protein
MADDVTITVHVRDLTGPGFNSVNRNLNQLQRQAQQMGGSLRIVGGQLNGVASAASNAGDALGGGGASLKAKAIGVAGVLGTTLLPAIGALSPILFGLAGVGGAAALAMDDLKEEAKKLKPEFEALQKTASKAVMPGVKRAMDDVKGAMKGLHPVVKVGGEAFGTFVDRAAKFANSPAFQSSLLKNVQMGSQFFGDFTDSLMDFTQAFMDFGTKSQPSLDAFQNLFGGMLDTGLPSMFKELERGIQGSADLINGLAGFLNGSLLPALGKIAGSWAEVFGPHAEQVLRTLGGAVEGFATIFAGAMTALEPLASVFTDGLRAMNDVGAIAFSVMGSLAKVLGEALLGTLNELAGNDSVGGLTDQFRGFSNWVQDNQTGIRMAFTMMAGGIIDMTQTGLRMLPLLATGFKMFAEMAINSLGAFLTVLTATFSGVPVIGDKFKGLLADFTEVSGGWLDSLDTMQQGVTDFANTALPRLDRAELKLNVEQAQANLDSIKKQLQDPKLTEERRAKLTVQKDAAERMLAQARANLRDFDNEKAEATLSADPRQFFGAVGSVNRTRLPGKSVRIAADTSAFRSAVGGIAGRVLGTSYINVQYRQAENNLQKPFSNANGSIMRFYANGGMENHVAQIAPAGSWRVWGEPETGGESYIPLAPSKRKRSRQIAEETVGILGGQVQWFARGGLTSTQLKGLSQPSDAGELTSTLSEVRAKIKASTSGGTESRLLRTLDAVGKKLIAHEKSLTSVNKALSAAKDKLNDLRTSASQLSGSVKSGVLSAASITSGASGNAPVTLGSITSGLIASRDKATAFASALKGLQSKGLRSDLIQQIAEAGINGGGLETAGALLGASSSEITTVNSLQSQIAGAAKTAGQTTATAVYGAAIKAQTDATNKLQKSQDALEKAMSNLTKALNKAITGKASGGIVGAAASGGIRGSLTWVGEQGPELLDLPAGSRVWSNPDSRRKLAEARAPWASMLNSPRRSPSYAPAPAAGGDGAPIVIQVRLADRDFGELWVDTGRKQVRAIGSIEATLKPPRGR